MAEKYPRTPHFPFSPGATRDDRINHDYWDQMGGKELIVTEKVDGENTCFKASGVYARSHEAPTRAPWARYLIDRWEAMKGDLGGLEIFGENLYAVHAIEYSGLESHFYVFAARENDRWLSWDDVTFYAEYFGFPTVPIIHKSIVPQHYTESEFEQLITSLAAQPSALGGQREGLVLRVTSAFPDNEFERNIIKWVREGHVPPDAEHWTKNWRRARLNYEK